MFKVGDKVRWDSQAGGNWKIKEGVIFEEVPAGKLPIRKEYGSYSNGYPGHMVMFESVLPRKHVSFLVEVRDGKTSKAKPKLYWPRIWEKVK